MTFQFTICSDTCCGQLLLLLLFIIIIIISTTTYHFTFRSLVLYFILYPPSFGQFHELISRYLEKLSQIRQLSNQKILYKIWPRDLKLYPHIAPFLACDVMRCSLITILC